MKLDVSEQKFLKRLGLRLRQLRKEKGWTLEDAEEHGWPNWRHLQKIEAGKNVTILTLRRAAELYGVDLSELFKEN
ncbi:helix-turn-helix transcriptional regulator [Bdellovibrio sp.]|uniref:helix-turn-helix domain-containing protein n=1 Tax=Bdellovibrio sp. TaxID=28201 RepID=UPI0032220BA0